MTFVFTVLAMISVVACMVSGAFAEKAAAAAKISGDSSDNGATQALAGFLWGLAAVACGFIAGRWSV